MPGVRVSGSGAFPSLAERLVDGQAEFGRLAHVLLRAYAMRARFQLHAGPTGIVGYGVPEFDGPVDFRIVWSERSTSTSFLGDFLQKLGLLEEKRRTDQKAPRTHVVLVSPVDLTLSERTWLESRKITPGFAVHHWGATRLWELLRDSPPLLARYYPESVPALFDANHPANYRQTIAQYREKVALVHRRVRLLGFPPEVLREQDAHSDIGLREIFVPLQFVADNEFAARKQLLELFGDKLGIVVLADPGMGKSTLLTFLSLVVAGAAELRGLAVTRTSYIPLLIPLREYARAHQQDPTLGFIDYLALRARTDLSLPSMVPAFFEAALRMGEALVLFDGLDEVGSITARHRVSKAIVAFKQEYSLCRFFVTARIHGYTSDIALPRDSFDHVRIAPLEDEQVNDFLGRWYAIQIPDNPRELNERKESLRRAIFRTPSVRRLAGNPLLLTLMAFLHRTLGQLPEDRCELYERCVDMLLRSWQEAKGPLEADEIHPFERLRLRPHVQKEYLAYLALNVQERIGNEPGADDARGLFPRDVALDVLTTRHLMRIRRERPTIERQEAEDEIRAFLDYIGERTGLLVDRGNGQLSFLHLSFQEYLAAWVYTCEGNAYDLPGFFVKHLNEPAWSEVLLLRLYIVLRGQGGGGERAFDAITSALFRELERRSTKLGWVFLGRALRDRLTFLASHRDQILRKLLEGCLEEQTFGSDWYNVLDEVRLFGEPTASEALRGVFADVQRSARPMAAIAALCMEARLFDVPEDAAGRFRARADLREFLPDLIAFLDEPGFAELLAEHATVDDWELTLGMVDSPAVYRLTLGWATGSMPCPVRGDAPLLGALRVVRQKTAQEIRSRTAFAERFAQSDATSLFRRPGRIAVQERFGHIEAPLSSFVVVELQATNNDGAKPARKLLVPGFVYHRLSELFKSQELIERALARWPAAVLRDHLGPFLNAASIADESLARFGQAFARNFVQAVTSDVFVHGLLMMGMPFWGVGTGDGEDRIQDSYRKFAHGAASQFSKAAIASKIDPHGEIMNRAVGHGSLLNDDIIEIYAREFAPLFAPSYGLDFIHGLNVHTSLSMPSWRGRVPLLPDVEALARAAMADPMKIPEMLAHRNVWITASTNQEGKRSFDVDRSCTAIALDVRNPIALPIILARLPELVGVQAFFCLCRHLAIEDPDGATSMRAFDEWTKYQPIEVFLVGLAWEHHAETIRDHFGRLEGAAGALAVAHAEYASAVTGTRLTGPVWTRLLAEKDPSVDNQLTVPVATATPTMPLQSSPAKQPAAVPTEQPPVFTWLHLSDIHFGYQSARQRWDQRLVLAALRDDLAKLSDHNIPKPNAIFVTGDIAWSGRAEQYVEARQWLDELRLLLGIGFDCIFAVPGNHDVDRSADADTAIKRLVRGLRNGDEDLDDALDHAEDRARLARRKKDYLDFVENLGNVHAVKAETRMFWSHAVALGGGYGLHAIGLDTAILAMDDSDQGKLRVGKKQIAQAYEGKSDERTIVVVLGHHPLRDRWLHDEREVERNIRRVADVYLSGHVHDHESESMLSGGDTGLIRIAAGAVHGDQQREVPPSHGYNVASIIRDSDGDLVLRVYPRRFSPKNGDFRTDVEAIPEGKTYARHKLRRKSR